MKANTKKNSTTKKLVPAAGSLLISAAMLGTSTYAWFTMSREVELKNIQMTATTPEDVQIAIGALGTTNAAAVTVDGQVSLSANTGVLVRGSGATNADNGGVLPPTTDAWNWSNTADISNYYAIGKLIPASSINGTNIYFTPDADGVGQTIKSGAVFIQADNGTANGAGAADSGTTTSYKATLHALTTNKAAGGDGWQNTSGSYKNSTEYNYTNDDGYYVDIPVWLRTSSTGTTTLGVEAYVKPATDVYVNEAGQALYKAVRVAILNGNQTALGGAAASGTTGLLPVADGMNGSITTNDYGTLSASPFGGTSILDWYGHSGTGVTASTSLTGEKLAASSIGTASTRFDATIYNTPSVYNKSNGFVTLSKGVNNGYGPATQVIVRVWLEGEDPDCWNDTAGQDWSINIKFFKIGSNPSDADINTASNS